MTFPFSGHSDWPIHMVGAICVIFFGHIVNIVVACLCAFLSVFLLLIDHNRFKLWMIGKLLIKIQAAKETTHIDRNKHIEQNHFNVQTPFVFSIKLTQFYFHGVFLLFNFNSLMN